VTRVVELAIVDARRKPAAVAATLSRPEGRARLSRNDVVELAEKGFYFTADGRLVSKQGEVLVHTASGIFYVLRFGEVAYREGTTSENRYLFVSVGFDPNVTNGTVNEDIKA